MDDVTRSQSVHVRLLIPRAWVGSIIGKGGAVIQSIRSQTGCSVKITGDEEPPYGNPFGPHGPALQPPPDRIVMLSGLTNAVERAVGFVLNVVREALRPEEAQNADATGTAECRYLVPNTTVSLIIGKSGSRVQQLREETGARIQISPRDDNRMDTERIVSIFGTFSQIKEAAIRLVAIIQEDPYSREFHAPHPPNQFAMGARYPPMRGIQAPSTAGALMGPSISRNVMMRDCEIYLQVPDNYVGSLVGKNGESLANIRRQSGARVNISQRDEFVPGTQDRLVTLSGSVEAVHCAHILIIHRLHEFADVMPQHGLNGPQVGSNSQETLQRVPHLYTTGVATENALVHALASTVGTRNPLCFTRVDFNGRY